ncbi:MAG: Ig-like domain-containing protein [Planctomycetes bacterium]|nr:Ig-like domain-containing protein [Planctomycetota bacterium]
MARWVCCLILVLLSASAGDAAFFIRGDANFDGELDISDPQFTLYHLFLGEAAPPCPAAADANDDEEVDISDPIATLGFLFLGRPALPLPWPAPGPDPTPGLGCGLAEPLNLSCARSGPAVLLSWKLAEAYTAIEVRRDGRLIAALSGNATAYRDAPARGGSYLYGVRGVQGNASTGDVACRASGLPDNRPPALTLLSPAPGALVDGESATVRGRVSDDGKVAKVLVEGIDATPAGPPVLPFEFQAAVPLAPGLNLLRLEAVDEAGRTAFLELGIGRASVLLAGQAARGLLLDLTGQGGYGELEAILQPFLSQVPAALDGAVRGAVLYQNNFLGVDLRVIGNRVEVAGAVGLDLYPSAAGGGRIGMTVRLDQVKLFAEGRSDYGFLGTDGWNAVWTASQVTIDGAFALSPKPGGAGLEVASDGFTVGIGGSELTVSGFLDPFGIFDSLLNFLAGLFRGQIEAEVKRAVEQAADQEILPALADALSGLKIGADLGSVALDTRFAEAVESLEGLSVVFDATWRGKTRDPGFPVYPGSAARFAPPPPLPLEVPANHPVDATLSLSADTLNQALAEMTASGMLDAAVDLGGLESAVPLTVETLTALLGPRLGDLPGVAPDQPLGIRVQAAMPISLQLTGRPPGRAVVGPGESWRYAHGEPPAAWKAPGFDDGSWAEGPSGFGYSNAPAELRLVKTELAGMAGGAYLSLYLRKKFALVDPAIPRGLILRVLYDDGFAAYLNGQEVARVNLPGAPGTPVPSTAAATAAIEPAWIDIDLAPFRGLLRAGENTLALQGHNAGASSSDFILVPELLEPLPLPPGAFGSAPVEVAVDELVAALVADTARDGVGASDKDGRPDEVELFAYRLSFRLAASLILARGENGAPRIAFAMATDDGPDADPFPDALAEGAAGLSIGVARESVDLDDALLASLGELFLGALGPALGGALAGLELPSFELPRLSFDLNGDGAADARLDLQSATLAPLDTTGEGEPDWLCILTDLRKS